jgi:tetratricopeptide (TPR) repeat protein
MRLLARIVLLVAIVWLVIAIVYQLRPAPTPEGAEAPTQNIFNVFVLILLFAGTLGAIVAFFLLPAIGEWVGHLFIAPNERIEKGEYDDALAFANQGDYEGAIAAYRNVLRNNPEDTHALNEIVHLYCDKLNNYDAAAAELEEALQREWSEEKGAFVASRLAEVYWKYQGDADRARAILTQIMESMPETRHAANARHKLRDIEIALRTGSRPQVLGDAEEPAEAGGDDTPVSGA